MCFLVYGLTTRCDYWKGENPDLKNGLEACLAEFTDDCQSDTN